MESAKTWKISTVLVLSCFSSESFINPWISMLKPYGQKSNLSQQKLWKMVYGNNIILLPSLSFAPSVLLSGHRNSHRPSELFRYQNYFYSKYPLTQNGTCWYPVGSEQCWQYISWPIRSHWMAQKQPIRSQRVVKTCLISDTSSSVMPNSSAFFCSDIMYLNTYLVLWT